MTEIAPSRVAQIVDHERQAAQLAAASDAHQWEAARLIAEELDGGKSQRQLAADIGKSQTHVSFMARAWRDYQGNQVRPAFAEAYQAIKAKPASAAIEAPKARPAMTRDRAELLTGVIKAQIDAAVSEAKAALLQLLAVGASLEDVIECITGADDGFQRSHPDDEELAGTLARLVSEPLLDAVFAAAAASA